MDLNKRFPVEERLALVHDMAAAALLAIPRPTRERIGSKGEE
jgi:hypothetical protein